MRLEPNTLKACNDIGMFWNAIPEWHKPELKEGEYKMCSGATKEEAEKNFWTQNDK